LRRPRGAKPKKLEQVKEAMRNDIRQGRRTVAELSNMREKVLAAEYGVSRDTARKARKALSEFVENSILNK
jgi:DNA-binding GntR family transcriptional regulator